MAKNYTNCLQSYNFFYKSWLYYGKSCIFARIMDRNKEIYKVTLVGGAVNVLLLLFKFVAGIVGHSAAMVADAVHSLSDFVTDIIVLVFVHISGKPKDKSHDYGHGKYETLAMTLIGVALLTVAIGILYNGAMKIVAWLEGEQLQAPGLLALLAALLSRPLGLCRRRCVYREGGCRSVAKRHWRPDGTVVARCR